MQIQIKCMRTQAFATVILLAGSLLLPYRILADGPPPKGKQKQVPSYVSAHYDKPKIRSVHSNKAVIRSGPSEKYYSTSTLLNGASVDVYMETSDGWSGIRPPAGSHNWIPSNIAYLLPGGKSAEITEDKAPAWIGSDANEVSEFMWQTELSKTQQVQVLGEELQMMEDGKKQLWYRIAPPQGEFRWVKTSQLSDSRSSSPNDSAVQLANYQQDEIATLSTRSKLDSKSGKVVWSDEKQTLEQVERQIKREQEEIQSKMAADGIRVNIDAPSLALRSGSKQSSVVNNPDAETDFPVSEPDEMDFVEAEHTSAASTGIHPIPMRTNQKRTSTSANTVEHQIDGQRQWEAMQSTDPKLRVTPVRSLLGLIGFSIIEAERAPVHTQIAQQYHTTRSQGSTGWVGPVGTSRLDRLPRPGQRGHSLSPPSYSLPPLEGSVGIIGHQMHAVPIPSGPPMHQGETTFSRWLNAREPLFGSPSSNLNPMLATMGGNAVPQVNDPISQSNMNSYAGSSYARSTLDSNWNGPGPATSPFELETSAWHGLSPSVRNANSTLPTAGLNAASLDSQDDPDQFETPEIQSALVSLTREVAAPTQEWNFSALRNQAASWVENSTTPMVRGEARLLLERIERFEALRLRTLGLANDASMIAQQSIGNAATAALRQSNAVSPASATASGTNVGQVSNAFATSSMKEGDASGWLVQVHTSSKGQPEFALTDDAGKVITYVQSSAALNLRRYLQQPVTVYGVRGYIPNLAAKQIFAERVVRMR